MAFAPLLVFFAFLTLWGLTELAIWNGWRGFRTIKNISPTDINTKVSGGLTFWLGCIAMFVALISSSKFDDAQATWLAVATCIAVISGFPFLWALSGDLLLDFKADSHAIEIEGTQPIEKPAIKRLAWGWLGLLIALLFFVVTVFIVPVFTAFR